jgi:HSP20 family protein
MRLFRWGSAFEAFRDLQREMDRLLESVNSATEGLRYGRPYPAVNIYDADTEFLITVEVPGIAVGDVELSMANGVLTMKGNRVDSQPVSADQFRRSERPGGHWERQFSLPERIQEEAIRAELKNGVLLLRLPKSPSTQPRQIPVLNGGA